MSSGLLFLQNNSYFIRKEFAKLSMNFFTSFNKVLAAFEKHKVDYILN